jgi:hypothetical protein
MILGKGQTNFDLGPIIRTSLANVHLNLTFWCQILALALKDLMGKTF